LITDDNRVPGIGPALIADDEIVLAGKEIDDFAFGLVAPLQTNNAGARHGSSYFGPNDGERALEPGRRRRLRFYESSAGMPSPRIVAGTVGRTFSAVKLAGMKGLLASA
jgi:hypothetical protein